jgi:hypothetical protein
MIRRYETDYAGAWRGHCTSRENAIIAAMKHVVSDGYSRCTITDKVTTEVVARVRLGKDRCSAAVDVIEPFQKVPR